MAATVHVAQMTGTGPDDTSSDQVEASRELLKKNFKAGLAIMQVAANTTWDKKWQSTRGVNERISVTEGAAEIALGFAAHSKVLPIPTR